MEMLLSLWLPILVSTVVLFFASFLAWAVLPHHKPDYRKFPDEDRLMEVVRAARPAAGEYIFPFVQPDEMKEEGPKARYEAGPWGVLNVWPAAPNMGRNMALTVLSIFVITVLVAYVGAAALPAGASFGLVFQVVGTTAILAHTTGAICREIWFTRPLRAKLMDLLDGLAYGVITGVLFGLMWP